MADVIWSVSKWGKNLILHLKPGLSTNTKKWMLGVKTDQFSIPQQWQKDHQKLRNYKENRY